MDQCEEAVSALIDNLSNIPPQMKLFSSSMRLLYSKRNSTYGKTWAPKILRLCDTVQAESTTYLENAIPLLSQIIRSISNLFDNYEMLEYDDWLNEIDEITKEVQTYKIPCEAAIKLHHRIMCSLKQRENKIKNLSYKLDNTFNNSDSGTDNAGIDSLATFNYESNYKGLFPHSPLDFILNKIIPSLSVLIDSLNSVLHFFSVIEEGLKEIRNNSNQLKNIYAHGKTLDSPTTVKDDSKSDMENSEDNYCLKIGEMPPSQHEHFNKSYKEKQDQWQGTSHLMQADNNSVEIKTYPCSDTTHYSHASNFSNSQKCVPVFLQKGTVLPRKAKLVEMWIPTCGKSIDHGVEIPGWDKEATCATYNEGLSGIKKTTGQQIISKNDHGFSQVHVINSPEFKKAVVTDRDLQEKLGIQVDDKSVSLTEAHTTGVTEELGVLYTHATKSFSDVSDSALSTYCIKDQQCYSQSTTKTDDVVIRTEQEKNQEYLSSINDDFDADCDGNSDVLHQDLPSEFGHTTLLGMVPQNSQPTSVSFETPLTVSAIKIIDNKNEGEFSKHRLTLVECDQSKESNLSCENAMSNLRKRHVERSEQICQEDHVYTVNNATCEISRTSKFFNKDVGSAPQDNDDLRTENTFSCKEGIKGGVTNIICQSTRIDDDKCRQGTSLSFLQWLRSFFSLDKFLTPISYPQHYTNRVKRLPRKPTTWQKTTISSFNNITRGKNQNQAGKVEVKTKRKGLTSIVSSLFGSLISSLPVVFAVINEYQKIENPRYSYNEDKEKINYSCKEAIKQDVTNIIVEGEHVYRDRFGQEKRLPFSQWLLFFFRLDQFSSFFNYTQHNTNTFLRLPPKSNASQKTDHLSFHSTNREKNQLPAVIVEEKRLQLSYVDSENEETNVHNKSENYCPSPEQNHKHDQDSPTHHTKTCAVTEMVIMEHFEKMKTLSCLVKQQCRKFHAIISIVKADFLVISDSKKG